MRLTPWALRKPTSSSYITANPVFHYMDPNVALRWPDYILQVIIAFPASNQEASIFCQETQKVLTGYCKQLEI